ncbi:hypothetical protein [Hyalangium rubrum]|uniref:Uncharacterized protein n=1 Tax=Hyalangium rubrum TaxID=3103134 RepID=A0ABU5HEX3_9BACT|nr:hypothetical protein [Hyalangium sp. s54d21]MDY7232013.1 hypothetical protein [Hyalangium sp. s54d21]
MMGVRTGVARSDISQCITASLKCQAACEAGMTRLVSEGHAADSDNVRLLRQCAELCELNARALQKDSSLARRTASICFELSSQVARVAWLDSNATSAALARDALILARACKLLLFAN